MSKVRKLDADGDMRFGNEQADFFTDDPEGVAQNIQTRLNLWTGDWYLDVTEGTPWADAVLGTGTKEFIEPVLRARILGTPAVLSLESFQLIIDADQRTAQVLATVETEFGSAVLEATI